MVAAQRDYMIRLASLTVDPVLLERVAEMATEEGHHDIAHNTRVHMWQLGIRPRRGRGYRGKHRR